jgi:hypothetical protein
MTGHQILPEAAPRQRRLEWWSTSYYLIDSIDGGSMHQSQLEAKFLPFLQHESSGWPRGATIWSLQFISWWCHNVLSCPPSPPRFLFPRSNLLNESYLYAFAKNKASFFTVLVGVYGVEQNESKCCILIERISTHSLLRKTRQVNQSTLWNITHYILW